MAVLGQRVLFPRSFARGFYASPVGGRCFPRSFRFVSPASDDRCSHVETIFVVQRDCCQPDQAFSVVPEIPRFLTDFPVHCGFDYFGISVLGAPQILFGVADSLFSGSHVALRFVARPGVVGLTPFLGARGVPPCQGGGLKEVCAVRSGRAVRGLGRKLVWGRLDRVGTSLDFGATDRQTPGSSGDVRSNSRQGWRHLKVASGTTSRRQRASGRAAQGAKRAMDGAQGCSSALGVRAAFAAARSPSAGGEGAGRKDPTPACGYLGLSTREGLVIPPYSLTSETPGP